jgi:hypothetical protein
MSRLRARAKLSLSLIILTVHKMFHHLNKSIAILNKLITKLKTLAARTYIILQLIKSSTQILTSRDLTRGTVKYKT